MIKASRTSRELSRLHAHYSRLLGSEYVSSLVWVNRLADAKREIRFQHRIEKLCRSIERELKNRPY